MGRENLAGGWGQDRHPTTTAKSLYTHPSLFRLAHVFVGRRPAGWVREGVR